MIGALLLSLFVPGEVPTPSEPPPPPPPMACDAGFDGVMNQIKMIPDIRRSVLPFSTPLQAWFDDDASTIYFVTIEGVPAHPSVIRVKIALAGEQLYMQPSGCTYGRQDQVERLQSQVDAVVKRLVQDPPE